MTQHEPLSPKAKDPHVYCTFYVTQCRTCNKRFDILTDRTTQFCPDCPEKQKKAGYGRAHSTFCRCEFLAERAERVVYPEGWS